MARKLRVIEGPDKSREFPLPESGEVQLGRGRDTLTELKDPGVSRKHCRLEVNDGRVVLTNDSPLGTQVNGQPITTKRELQINDVVHIGDTQLKFEMARILRVIDGPDKQREFFLPESGEVRIGRGSDTLTDLKDPKVSDKHCRLEINNTRVVLTNDSPLGTLVNGQPVTTKREIQNNDIIKVGDTQLQFEGEDYRDDKTVGPGGFKAPPTPGKEDLSGTTLAHFQLDRVMAHVASGTVYQATDKTDDRTVTLKVFALHALPQLKGFPGILRPVLGIHHPNLVTLHEADRTGEHCWIASEYVEGETLEKHLQQPGLSGSLDWQLVLRFGINLASGLDALHQKHVTHRNLTPGSILITRADRQAKLASLWRARAVKDTDTRSDMQDVLRNAVFMPPERLAQSQPNTVRGDIYSLGAVLYSLIAGRPPFEGKTEKDAIAQVVQTEPVSLQVFQPSLPPAFERVVLRMMAKQPENRYATAADLLAALRSITEKSTSPPPPPVPPAPPVPSPVSSVAPQPVEGKISVTCKCGQMLAARKQFAGTRVRCPCCGTFITLPGKSSFVALLDQPAPQAPRPVAASQHLPAIAPTPALPRPPAKRLMREVAGYGVVVGLLILALLLSLAGILWDPSPSQEQNKSTPRGTAPARLSKRRLGHESG